MTENQRRFVASNRSSAAAAYVLATNGGYPMSLSIYQDETMVGFVLIVYGITGYEIPNVGKCREFWFHDNGEMIVGENVTVLKL